MKSVPFKNGYYAVGRKVCVEEIYGDKSLMAVWLYLTGQAGYTPGHWRDKDRVLILKAGELVLSIRSASKICGMAQQTFKKAILKLHQKGLVAFETMRTGTLVRLAHRAFDAVSKARAQFGDHKERKDITRSYKPLGDLYFKPQTQGVRNWVPGVEATKTMLEARAKEKIATSIPSFVKEFLGGLHGGSRANSPT